MVLIHDEGCKESTEHLVISGDLSESSNRERKLALKLSQWP